MGSIRAFKAAFALTKKETAFGQAINNAVLLDMLKWNDFEQSKYETKYRTDADEANYADMETEHEVESRRGSLSRKLRASVESAASFLIMQQGNLVTTGSGDPWTHSLRNKQVFTLNPPSFAFAEGLDSAGTTATFTGYKGCVIDQVDFQIDGQGPIMQTVVLKDDGSETDESAYSFPTAFSPVNRLLGSQAVLKYGPAGGAFTDITSLLETAKITSTSAIVEPKRSAAGIYVTEYQYGDKHPALAMQFLIKADKSHDIYKNYKGTANKGMIQLIITKSATRLMQLNISQCVFNAEPKHGGQEPQLEVIVLPEANATDGTSASALSPCLWTFKTGNSAYLVAA
jgi:hypothetical protein